MGIIMKVIQEKFEHYIITPFNLRKYPYTNLSYAEWYNWSCQRIDLFKKYCFLSLLNQKCQNFKWLLYFDETTPLELRMRLSDLEPVINIRLIYVNGFPDFMERYPKDVIQMCSPDTEWVITSRLDNDDCLHCEAFMEVQKAFIPKHNYMISLSSGYVYSLSTGLLSHYYYPNSPFISLIENVNEDIRGIFSQPNHCAWKELRFNMWQELKKLFSGSSSKNPAVFISHKVLWLQIYHGKNISNSFYRGLPVLGQVKLSEFGNIKENRPASWISVFRYCNYFYLKVYLKVSIINICRKIINAHERNKK